MTIDEAIKHCEEKAKQLEGYAEPYRSMGNCEKCAEEHRRLAGWLKELKQLREQTAWIVPIILIDKKGEEHDGLMDMRRMLIYLHNIPAETAISSGYTWKLAERRLRCLK